LLICTPVASPNSKKRGKLQKLLETSPHLLTDEKKSFSSSSASKLSPSKIIKFKVELNISSAAKEKQLKFIEGLG